MRFQQGQIRTWTRGYFRRGGERAQVVGPFVFAFLFSAYAVFHASAAVFPVTNLGDGTMGPTLRAAILTANLTPGRDTISFAIAGAGPHTIAILSPLPQITDNAGVLIDGFSQPGSGPGVTPPSTLTLKIIVDGTNAGAAHGFWIVSQNNVIRGVVVQNFQQDGIRIEATPSGTHTNLIYGNIIGVNVGGTLAQGNGKSMSAPWGGVNILVNPQVLGTVFANTVKGCLISANYSEGVSISSCPPGDCYFNRVDSNFIGTTISGMQALGNTSDGVYIGEAAHDNQVWDNLISGNDTNGVCIVGYVDPTTQWFTDRNIIGRNIIGLAVDRSTPMPNGWYGVSIGRYGLVWKLGHARDNVIVSDTIASNGRCGVMILEHPIDNANADRNKITQNSIFANGWLGIDLDDDGMTPNDAGDPDQRANQQLNMPVITNATWLAGITTVTGTVDIGSVPSTAVVEVFKAAGNTSEFSQILGPIVPVEWISIHAAYHDGVVQLRWTTAAEINNACFEIERQGGGSAWRRVGSVPGSGTTNAECRYTFTDPLRDLGAETLLRYRIAQIDYDGTRDYSPEVFVELSALPPLPIFHPVWPNPASSQLFLCFTLSVETDVRITLSDMCGREVFRVPSAAVRAAGAGTLRIDTEFLPGGSYELVCRAGDVCEVQWVRIVK